MKRFCAFITLLLAASLLMAPMAFGQSLNTGAVVGTVTDPSHAVVPGATVELKNLGTGGTQADKTNGTGYYRFSLLPPGNYQVTVKQSGFATAQVPVTVSVGVATTADVTMTMSATAQTIEVTGAVPVVSTTSASINTAFSQMEYAQLPNPGGDLTNIAQTAPGAVMNNTGGYGNFTVNGLPATSNLFTVNGENDMDPYFNINNSGATNLTLGSNEVQEATVISNAYSGEYGQLSGAQVTYVTKSGTNTFHGNAEYWWNGRTMNSNNWFNNNTDPVTPRPFSNANQWAASVGGPIIKNKTFFFFDTEGLRFILPNTLPTTIPSPAFATAVLNNVGAVQPSELPLYTQMMNLFANAKGASNAQPLPNNSACLPRNNNPNDPNYNPTGLVLPGFNGLTQNCFNNFNATPSALAHEYIIAFKIDQNIGQNDKVFVRYKLDHGLQPTYLDPISPNFDALSNQPAWDVQIQETHIFSPNMTNEFTAAGSHYVTQFAQNEALALSTFPQGLQFGGDNPLGPPNGIVGYQFIFPQGRNFTQYQFIDNLSWTHGHHSFKFGANFRRYDVSDHNFFYTNAETGFNVTSNAGNALQMFADGLAGAYLRADNLATNVPVALWGLGIYAMDEWKVKPNLTFTLALRVERNSNPVCQINCFSNFKLPWQLLPSTLAGPNAGSVPYTSDIAYNQHQAYHGVDALDWSPRVGFSWSPYSNGKTVISGGFGLFYDSPPTGLVDGPNGPLGNPPVSVTIRVRPTNGTLPFDPSTNGSVNQWTQSAQAFNAGFVGGQTYSQIAASLVPFGVNFAPPAFTALNGTIHAPQWQEWNLQFQQKLNPSTALVMNYVGNHGVQIPYANGFYNAYDANGIYPPGTLTATVPNTNYGTVQQIQSGAISNYNALTVSLRRNFSKCVSAHANYTWAHNLDELSNGGVFTYGDSLPLNQICPGSLRQCNYGSSDYDIRNGFNGDFVFNPGFHFGSNWMNQALGGWELSGKIFWRAGLPFSVVDGNLNGGVVNSTATILAQPILPGNAPGQMSCGAGAASASGAGTPCLNSAAFLDTSQLAVNGFSTQRRNQYVGPHYFDMDMSLYKTFKLGERVQFGVGAQAFNVFNHPNFSN